MLPLKTTPDPAGYVVPSTSNPDFWIAWEYEDGRYRYAGTYETQAAAEHAAGLVP